MKLLRILSQPAARVDREADQEVAVVAALQPVVEDAALVEDSVEAEDVEAVAGAAELLRAGVTL